MKKNKVVGPQKARRKDDFGEKDSVAARLRGQRKILELFGTVDFDPSYDYKAARRRKRT